MSGLLKSSRGALEGIRVLELGSMYAAPTSCRMLRDFGADVIKVEEPVTGDTSRYWAPRFDGMSAGFIRLNSGKRSVGLDLRQPHHREIVNDLAAHVDVIVEAFRPGRLESWGLGYDVLSQANPGLILTRVSGFGQTGPYRARPGFGTVAETACGFCYTNGWPDTPPTLGPFGLGDSIAGIAAALGTVLALYRRERDGSGDVVDVALYEPLMFILGDMILKYTLSGEIQERIGNGLVSVSPRGMYETADGQWVAIAASTQTITKRLFEAMEEPDLMGDPRFSTNEARLSNNDALQEMVSGWVGAHTREHVIAILEEHEVVSAAVNNARDIVNDPHFTERTLVNIIGNEALSNALMPGPILHLDSTVTPSYPGVPQIGEHTFEVLEELLGLSYEVIAQLLNGPRTAENY